MSKISTETHTETVVEEESPAEYDIDTLFKDAFEQQEENPYISCIFWGPEEGGKTYTACTFPGPIAYIDLDGGLDINLKYHRDKDGKPTKEIKRIRCISLEDDKENLADPKTYDGFKVDPINTLRNFDVATTVLQKKVGGTVVVDTMTAYNDWLKMLMASRIPKHIKPDTGEEYVDQFDWKYVNNKWLWSWEKLKNIQANLVVTAKSKPIYQKREITDQTEMDMRTNSGYQTSINAEFTKQITQEGTKIIVHRIAKFNKFRGNKLGSTYEVEDLTYDKLIEILKEEKQI